MKDFDKGDQNQTKDKTITCAVVVYYGRCCVTFRTHSNGP